MDYELLSKIFYKEPAEYENRYRQRFDYELSIKLPISIHDSQAFFTIPISMLNKIQTLYKISNKIDALTEKLPTIAIESLISKSLMDEITLTNDIEGVSSTRKEIEEAVLNQDIKKKARFKGLAAKYIKLINDSEIPLYTCEDIRKIYDDIVSDEIEPQDLPDGKIFRKEIVRVVSATQKIKHNGIMPEEKIIAYMNYCLELIKDDKCNMLIKVATIHYLFGYVHPFYDGNGRTSRFISSCLLKDELGILLALRLSYVIKNNIKTYYDAFDICNDSKNKGDLTPFILMFLNLLAEAAVDLFDKLEDLSERLNFYLEILKNVGMEKKKKSLMFILCQNKLFANNPIVFKDLTGASRISSSTTRKLLSELKAEGYVEITKKGRVLSYTATLTRLDELNQAQKKSLQN